MLDHMSAYDLVVYQWGFRADAPRVTTCSRPCSAWRFIPVRNMLYLWIYGNVEHRLGAGRICSDIWPPASPRVPHTIQSRLTDSAGRRLWRHLRCWASIWCGFRGTRWRVDFPVPLLRRRGAISATVVLIMYLVLDNLLPMLAGGGARRRARGAHRGFIAGNVAALIRIRDKR